MSEDFATVNEKVYQMSVIDMLNLCDDYGIRNDATIFQVDELCDELTRHLLDTQKEEQDE